MGVDPGTFRMGIGLLDSYGSDLALTYCGVLVAGRTDPLPTRLSYMLDELDKAIIEWRPAEVAIEQPFAGLNVRAAMAIGQAQAVAMVAAARHGLPVANYAPRQVKQAVTDYGGSSKEQVQQMVAALLGVDSIPGSSDAADALAVAICHVNATNVERMTAEV